jgi:hypothetical protein
MSHWFKGNITFDGKIDDVKKLVEDHASHFQLVVKTMPGMTKSEIEKTGSDYVHIRTNEGFMKRTNVKKIVDDEKVLIEFDESYDGGKLVNVNSHYQLEFKGHDDHIHLTCTIDLIKSRGFLGIVYKLFSSKSIGNATLKVYKSIIE